jgi:hypothetical protein
MNDLKSRLDGIRRDIEKLQAQEALLLEMMDESPAPQPSRAAKGSVKSTVIDLLEETGQRGVNAATAVELARARGITLERGSVSSLLSRLKSDGVVIHHGDTYRLKKYSEMPGVTPLRTSGDSQF